MFLELIYGMNKTNLFIAGIILLMSCTNNSSNYDSKKTHENNVISVTIEDELTNLQQLKSDSKNAPMDDACDWYYHEADSIINTVSINDTVNKNKKLMKVFYAESLYILGINYRAAVYECKLEEMDKLKIEYDNKRIYSDDDIKSTKEKLSNLIDYVEKWK